MRFAKEQIGKVFDLDRVDELFTDAIPMWMGAFVIWWVALLIFHEPVRYFVHTYCK